MKCVQICVIFIHGTYTVEQSLARLTLKEKAVSVFFLLSTNVAERLKPAARASDCQLLHPACGVATRT